MLKQELVIFLNVLKWANNCDLFQSLVIISKEETLILKWAKQCQEIKERVEV